MKGRWMRRKRWTTGRGGPSGLGKKDKKPWAASWEGGKLRFRNQRAAWKVCQFLHRTRGRRVE